MSGKTKRQAATWRGQRGYFNERMQAHCNTVLRADSIPVYRSDGRPVGEICDGILRKTARRAHMLQRPSAWAWDAAILDQAAAAGARFTEIECDGRIWRASLADFRRYGVPVNRGYGEQVALPLSFWQTRVAGETAVKQLSLFGGAT